MYPAIVNNPDRVGYASSWVSKTKGKFGDAKNWGAKKVPQKTDVVVAKGGNGKNDIEVSKATSVGDVMLMDTNLVVERNIDITGNLKCSAGGCPKPTEVIEATLFNM